MKTKADVLMLSLEIKKMMKELDKDNIWAYDFDVITRSFLDYVDYVHDDVDYLYLTRIKQFLINAKKNNNSLLEIKDYLKDNAEYQNFLAKAICAMNPLKDKKREELIEIQNQNYNILKEKLSFFKNGYTILGLINKIFFDMTKKEMNEFFNRNSVSSSNNYIEYMNDNIIKYYASLLKCVANEVDIKKSKLKGEQKEQLNYYQYGNTNRITKICENMKNLYEKYHEMTPLNAIKYEAFAQVTMAEVFPERNDEPSPTQR